MSTLQDHENSVDDIDLLKICWRHQGCGDCLKERETTCSWCPSSSTCVPNTAIIPILGPVFNPNICALWSERWELRASPLGCHISTITFLTCIISVLATCLAIGLSQLALKLVPAARRKWKNRSPSWWKIWTRYHAGWWTGWRLRLVDRNAGEQRPLLGGS